MPSAPCLFFRGFHLDLTTETLWEGPQRLPLRPKAWALLRYLVENPQRLISQAELVAAIWQREYVSDGLLRGPSVSSAGCYMTRRRPPALSRR